MSSAAPATAPASADGPTQLLTKEEVFQLIRVLVPCMYECASLSSLQALEALKQQGVPVSDKKYATMVKLLRSQNLASLGFTKVASSSSLGQPAAQPAPPSTASTSQPGEPATPAEPGQVGLVQMNEELQQQRTAPLNVKTSPFSAAQVHQLKAQILAYRYLTHNMALPSNLLLAIRGATPSVRTLSVISFLISVRVDWQFLEASCCAQSSASSNTARCRCRSVRDASTVYGCPWRLRCTVGSAHEAWLSASAASIYAGWCPNRPR